MNNTEISMYNKFCNFVRVHLIKSVSFVSEFYYNIFQQPKKREGKEGKTIKHIPLHFKYVLNFQIFHQS